MDSSMDSLGASRLLTGSLAILDPPAQAKLPLMMQNLKLNNSGNGTEPKFYHYCYVCNTQLNSCKQALLHCSGKRHRKKLQFLQSRKHPVGQLPTGTHIGAPPPPAMPCSNGPGDSAATCYPPVFPTVPNGHSVPNMASTPQFLPAEQLHPSIPMAGVSGTSFFPHASILRVYSQNM